MKKLTTGIGVFGPYANIVELEDRYRCDDADLQFSIVGRGTVAEAQPGDFPPPPRDPAEVQSEIIIATQARLDDFARTRNYDGILSLCTYATSANPKFKQEGLYGVEVRDSTWAKLYEILAEVESGVRPIPSGYAEIESELPQLAWPN